MPANVSKSGVWVNTDTGNVVHSEPDEGFPVVLPGGEIDPVAAAVIDAIGGPTAHKSKDATPTTKEA